NLENKKATLLTKKQGRLQGGLNKIPDHHALQTQRHHQKLLEGILFICKYYTTIVLTSLYPMITEFNFL
ncbi:MAG: hypothetical protein II840_12235, partial [Kiritimatiellae bacterium]|nr:hypothetical protein [Kiritimatiellia bacterium]